jgi:hypothetical protein
MADRARGTLHRAAVLRNRRPARGRGGQRSLPPRVPRLRREPGQAQVRAAPSSATPTRSTVPARTCRSTPCSASSGTPTSAPRRSTFEGIDPEEIIATVPHAPGADEVRQRRAAILSDRTKRERPPPPLPLQKQDRPQAPPGHPPIVPSVTAAPGRVLHVRLRKGPAASARGALRFVDELIARVTRAGATGINLSEPAPRLGRYRCGAT